LSGERLNILVINWQDITNPLAGGAEVHLHEIFARLAGLGHKVTLLCHRFDGSPAEEVRNGIRIIRHGGRFLFNFWVPFLYFKVSRKERFDVIVDDINKIPFYTPLFVREPIQGVTHHLFGRSIFLEAPFLLALYVFLSEKLIKLIYRKVHLIIGSPSTFHEYRAWGFPSTQVSVVNYCVNHDTYFHDESNTYSVKRIGYFGRLRKYKSVEHLITAFAQLLQNDAKLELHIIGDGDDRQRLEKYVAKLGIQFHVHFHGFIPEEKKAPLLQTMNFIVNTSSKEGWGLTVVEANACGIPVIAANVPGLRDSVIDGKTGVLYEYGNLEMLRLKMKQLLDSVSFRNTLRENALEWAASFDWGVAAHQTLEYIYATIEKFKKEKIKTPSFPKTG